MRLQRTTAALAALLTAATLGACADYTTTGVPADEEATTAAEGSAGHEAETEAEAEAEGAAAQDINAFAGTLVGMPVAQAEAATTEAGYVFRVVSVDGEAGPVTMDYREDRINVDVEDDTVVRVTIG
jgi:hypothetical protein